MRCALLTNAVATEHFFAKELDGDDVLCRIEEEKEEEGKTTEEDERHPRAAPVRASVPKEPYYSSEAFRSASS